MFTSINAVLKQLNAEGWNDITLEYINKGVMTDTYKMHTKTKKYAVRCYPNPRRWLAEVEYSYLIDFAKNGIKAPLPVCTNKTESKITYLIYEWVEGETLNDKFTTLNEIVICIVYQHITYYPYIKNSSTNSNLVDYAI